MGQKHSSRSSPRTSAPPPQKQPSWQPRPVMSPSQRDKEAADSLRAEGNALFSKGKYNAAIEKYTEALTLCPAAILLTNRAFCHKKHGNWLKVAADSRSALKLDCESMKGHYFLGFALRETGELQDAIHHLTKALELARSSGDSIKDEIWREVAAAKYKKWENESAIRIVQRDALRARLTTALRALQSKELAAADHTGQLESRHAQESAALDALFTEAAQPDTPGDFSNAFACRLTLEPFREPVISSSGLSYERSALLNHLHTGARISSSGLSYERLALLNHLHTVGKFDPVTREPLTEGQLRLNLGLRAATQDYLDQNPWAWKDCC